MFLFFGAAMSSLAGATLVWRGSFLDRLWALNAGTYQRLAPIGGVAGVAFLVLGAVLLIAGAGWFSPLLGRGPGRCPGWYRDRGERGERHRGRLLEGGSGVAFLPVRCSVFFSVHKGELLSTGGPRRACDSMSLYLYVIHRVGNPPPRYFASLDFTPEKCEHFSLLGNQTHT